MLDARRAALKAVSSVGVWDGVLVDVKAVLLDVKLVSARVVMWVVLLAGELVDGSAGASAGEKAAL